MVHIILTGATGLVGSAVLSSLLASPTISRVSILSRRPVSAAEGHDKAEVILLSDFSSYPPPILDQLRGAKGCIWAMGKGSVGMNESDYTRLTHDWPLAAAKSLAASKIKDQSSPGFNFVYISGEGADTSGATRSMFGRVKGRTEVDLLETADNTSSALAVYNLRPAGVDGSNSQSSADRARTWQEIAIGCLYPALKILAPQYHTPVDSLADVAVKIAQGDGKPVPAGEGVEAGGWTLRNTAIRRLAGLEK